MIGCAGKNLSKREIRKKEEEERKKEKTKREKRARVRERETRERERESGAFTFDVEALTWQGQKKVRLKFEDKTHLP